MSAAPIVVVGLGQMGATFAHGFLRAGHAVHPVTRAMSAAAVAASVAEPELALLAVGEAALPGVLAELPEPWRDRVGLLQNELLPVDWRSVGIEDPTVAVVWFEKKRTKPLHPILPTPVGGPRAALVVEALGAIDLPARAVSPDELLYELVRKNLYILTANIAGLEVGGTVSELWSTHGELARAVAEEVIALEEWRAGESLSGPELIAGLAEAFDADPDHGCRGRSAPARLGRALETAREAGIEVPTLTRIATAHGV